MNIWDKDILTLIARKVIEDDDFYTISSFYLTSKTTMQICENLPRWIKYKKIREMLQSIEIVDVDDYVNYALYKGTKGDVPYLIYNCSTGKGHIIKGSFDQYINFEHFFINTDGGDFIVLADFFGIDLSKNRKIFLSLSIDIIYDDISIVLKETRDEAISECIKYAGENEKERLKKELEVGPCANYNLLNLRVIEVDIDIF